MVATASSTCSLANVFSSSMLSTIHWPLAGSSPPLYFQNLEELKALRTIEPNHQGGSRRSSTGSLSCPLDDILQDLPSAVETLFPSSDDDKQQSERRHFGLNALALLLIGHGYTDECHNLITPLSWPEDIYFAYGPSVYNQVSPAAKSCATFTHCLVHRREAFNVGEFGMLGFANAKFWSNAVAKSPGFEELPHSEWRASIQQLAADYQSTPSVQQWCNDHGFLENDGLYYYEERAVHELCAHVEKAGGDSTTREVDEEMREFAQQVAASEVRILLAHVLEKAGYDVQSSFIQNDDDATTDNISETTIDTEEVFRILPKQQVDEDVALSAAKIVSSAHLVNFETGGSIVLRRVVTAVAAAAAAAAAVVDDSTTATATVITSAVVGIACRLLKSPACKLVQSGGRLRIVLARKDTGYLSPGDCIASLVSLDKVVSQPRVDNDVDKEDKDSWVVFLLDACSETDPEAIFVNRLHGSRGETPTTVVQWSKGTIF
jgi:hypothetical protein